MISQVFFALAVRCIALWCAVTAAAAGVSVLALPAVVDTPAPLDSSTGFLDLLVGACATASLVAVGWLWVITTDVVARVLLAGRPERVVVRRAGAVRLLLLAVCGVAALGTAAPAAADDSRPMTPPSLSGLPFPDRPTGDAPVRDDGPSSHRHLVRPGDSLWAIAEERLGSGATAGEVADHWHRIYERNADVIGPDPDLILPGQRLDLPATD